MHGWLHDTARQSRSGLHGEPDEVPGLFTFGEFWNDMLPGGRQNGPFMFGAISAGSVRRRPVGTATDTELSRNANGGTWSPLAANRRPGVGARSRLRCRNPTAIGTGALLPRTAMAEPACQDYRASFCRPAQLAPRRTGATQRAISLGAIPKRLYPLDADGRAPQGLRRYPTPRLLAGASAPDPQLIRAAPHEQHEISSSHRSVCT
jgi:hypothetical protein